MCSQTDRAVVLTNARSEDDSVYAAHFGDVRADDLLNGQVEHFLCQRRTGIAVSDGSIQIAEVGRYAGNTQHTGLLVQDVDNVRRAHFLMLGQELDDSGVDVARAGAHRQTVERGEAHRSIIALAAVDRADRRTIAQMAGDQAQLLKRTAEHFGSLLGNILMAGAVEAVAADLVLLIVLVRDRVHIVRLRHSLMERSIKYGNHRYVRTHNLAAGLNTNQVGRIVQRCERYAVLDRLEHLFGDDNAVREELAAVYHAVTDCVDLAHRGDNTLFRIEQHVDDRLDRFLMGRHSDVELELFIRLVAGVGEHAVDADALAQALSHDLARFGVEQLVFQRRAAGIDNQNFHLQNSLVPYLAACTKPRKPI